MYKRQVYCEVHPYSTPLEKIKEMNPIGIIFTGGPNSVYDENSPKVDPAIFEMGVPILGLCYGCQLTAQLLGGSVKSAPNKEFGKTETRFNNQSKVFGNLPESGITWMSHNDYVDAMPTGFTSVAQTDDCPVAAMENAERKIYCFQYHPEVNHTENGIKMIRNFLFEVCGAKGDWSMGCLLYTSRCV